jgi:hypothetical protein
MTIINELPETGSGYSNLDTKTVKFMLHLQTDEMDIIQKMIFIDNIEYSPGIKELLTGELEGNYLLAKKMFENRELNKKLNLQLNTNNTPEKKSKI